ncbi:DMT family transporter [Novosphingobium sp. G106]|uniref:EamA family transporter n=1 Tax=Novosphingobium sp. G106 TaxID=2849500 RepID=UPI0020C4AABE|nr:hypothetical protein [Novosphingobium sp. G106]
MTVRAGRLGLLGGLAPLIAAMVSVCVGNSFAKGLFPLAGASGANALRLGLSALLLIAVFRPWRWRIGRAGWAVVVPYGATIACMNLCFYMALRTLPLGIAIAIEFLGPLGVAIYYSVRKADYLWIGCAALGVGSLLYPGRAMRRSIPSGWRSSWPRRWPGHSTSSPASARARCCPKARWSASAFASQR